MPSYGTSHHTPSCEAIKCDVARALPPESTWQCQEILECLLHLVREVPNDDFNWADPTPFASLKTSIHFHLSFILWAQLPTWPCLHAHDDCTHLVTRSQPSPSPQLPLVCASGPAAPHSLPWIRALVLLPRSQNAAWGVEWLCVYIIHAAVPQCAPVKFLPRSLGHRLLNGRRAVIHWHRRFEHLSLSLWDTDSSLNKCLFPPRLRILAIGELLQSGVSLSLGKWIKLVRLGLFFHSVLLPATAWTMAQIRRRPWIQVKWQRSTCTSPECQTHSFSTLRMNPWPNIWILKSQFHCDPVDSFLC